MKSPWPDEPTRIQSARTKAYALKYGGALTHRLLERADADGYLSPPKNVFLHIDVRCTYQEEGAIQHYRDAWHYDEAYLGWIYIEGPGATQVRDHKGRISSIPTGQFVPYHRIEHRCPPQPVAGWRYFMRILWCETPGIPQAQT